MKNLKKMAFAAAASFLIFTACKKTVNLNDVSTAIPKNALSVTSVNVNSLMQKADFESVKNMEFYKDGIGKLSNENPALAEIMKNPTKSGIDLTKNIYLTQDLNIRAGRSSNADMTILMSLSNISDFETMLKAGKVGNIEKKDGVNFINLKKEINETNADGFTISSNLNSMVAWNEKMAVLSSNSNENTVDEGNPAQGGKGGTSILKYFNTKPEESISKNEMFNKAMSATHDINSFMSFDKYAEEMKGAAAAMNVDPKALVGNYFTGYGDFEKGQIVSKSEFNINKILVKEWGILFKNNVKTDFSKYINGQNVGFAMTMGLDMKGLKEIINTNQQFKIAAEMAKGRSEFSIDDLCKALDGDMVIAANPKGKDWEGVMGFKIADKAAIQKLLNMLSQKEVILKMSDSEFTFSKSVDMLSKGYVGENGKLRIKDDILFVGSNEAVSQMTGNGSVKAEIKEALNKNIFGMYANFNQIFANSDDMKDPEFTEMMMTINGKNGESVIKTKDGNANSLKSLMKAANRWYLKNKTENAAREKEKPVEEKEEI
jgi:Domain of unknown function (DUF4836)